jgi:spermidine synthase
VGINLAVALTALKLGAGSPAAPDRPAAAAEPDEAAGLPLGLVLAAAAVAGFAFFLMELVWYRLLAPVLGGSIYTFGLILATALAGIGLGGALHPLVFRHRRPQAWHLAATCLLEALVILLPFALGDWLAVTALQLRSLDVFGFWGLTGSWIMITGLVVFPAAVVSGLQFPLMISLLGRGLRDLGRQTGLAYAYNTGGAILGSLAGGFGLLPRLTAPGCWLLAGGLLLALGLAVAVQAGRQVGRVPGASRPAWAPLLATLVLTLLCFTAAGPTAVWRHAPIGAGRVGSLTSLNELRGWMNDTRRTIFWEADGVESAVGIQDGSGYNFLINGKSDGHVIGDRGTQTMMGLLGAALHPAPRRALVVGLGTGSTAGWLSAVPSLDQVDVVELEPAVLQMARLSAPANRNVMAKAEAGAGVRIIINDAREVLNTTPDKYDLIVSEPSNPYRAGIAGLFTREFYREVAGRLNPDGLFLGWCQAYEIETTSVFTIIATLKSVFPHVECWATQVPGDLVFLASREPPRPDPEVLAARLASSPYREALRLAWGVEGLEGFLAHHLANNDLTGAIARTVNPANLNTDDLNPVEYAYAHSVGHRTNFSAFDLFAAALARGWNQPAWAPKTISLESLGLNLFLAAAYNEQSIIPAADRFPESLRKRTQAVRSWQAGDFSALPAQWPGETRPDSRLESLALAESLTRGKKQDQDRALTLVPAFEDWWPACAALIKGFLAFNQEHPAEAVGELETAFQILRNSPGEIGAVVERGLRLTLTLTAGHPEYAGRLYAALEEPFPLHLLESARRITLLDLADRISPHKAAEALERWYEPNPVWDEVFLKRRLSVYAAIDHPRLARARADLELFLSSADPSVATLLNAAAARSRPRP